MLASKDKAIKHSERLGSQRTSWGPCWTGWILHYQPAMSLSEFSGPGFLSFLSPTFQCTMLYDQYIPSRSFLLWLDSHLCSGTSGFLHHSWSERLPSASSSSSWLLQCLAHVPLRGLSELALPPPQFLISPAYLCKYQAS